MTQQRVADGAPTGADAVEPARRERAAGRADVRGWLGVTAMTLVVAASWGPHLNTPLGDNHLGRITGRYALHLRNLQEKGLFDSRLGADWSPYLPTPYAHHPPLRNLLDVLFSVLPGGVEYRLRLGPCLLALLAVPAAAALLRAFEVRWVPTLLAVGLMITTPFYWVYGQFGFDLGPILLLSALAVHLCRRPDPPRRSVVATAATAAVAALASWPGLAFAVTLAGWVCVARRLDRAAVAVAASASAGALVSVAYVVGLHGPGAVAAQAELRTVGGAITTAEFLQRQGEYLTAMLPLWYRLAAPLMLAAALLDRRVRGYTTFATLLATGWVVVLKNGAFVHEYWAYLVLVPGLVGAAALADRVARWLPRPVGGVAAVAVACGLVVAFAAMALGETARRYVERPADAGRLVKEHPPAEGQRFAWHVQLGAPRWLAYYWDLPPRRSSPRVLAERARPEDLVVVNLADLPGWLPPSIASRAVATEGTYGLYRAEDLLAAARR